MATPTVDAVTIDEAGLLHRDVLDRLLQLYLHDFSEYASLGSSYGEVDENGQFAYRGLESYWQEAGRIPLLIRADGRIAGFVLLNQWSALDRPVDRAVAEFFVLRKYRRAHVGARAAHLVFHRYPGQWEVPVADYNRAALLFWRETLHSLGVGEIAEFTGDGRRWSGTVLRFDAGQPHKDDRVCLRGHSTSC
jgi:predicted acetyltransferase